MAAFLASLSLIDFLAAHWLQRLGSEVAAARQALLQRALKLGTLGGWIGRLVLRAWFGLNDHFRVSLARGEGVGEMEYAIRVVREWWKPAPSSAVDPQMNIPCHAFVASIPVIFLKATSISGTVDGVFRGTRVRLSCETV